MISGGTRDSADETSEERIDEFDLNRFQPLNSILFHERDVRVNQSEKNCQEPEEPSQVQTFSHSLRECSHGPLNSAVLRKCASA